MKDHYFTKVLDTIAGIILISSVALTIGGYSAGNYEVGKTGIELMSGAGAYYLGRAASKISDPRTKESDLVKKTDESN